jgi:hypothetical protein
MPKYSPQRSVLRHPQTSLPVKDQVSQPHKTTGKIIVLYVLIFKSVDRRRQDKRFSAEW